MQTNTTSWGIALRTPHLAAALDDPGRVEHYEVVTETVIEDRGARWEALLRLRRERPIMLHGLGMDVCGADAVDAAYVKAVRAVSEGLEPLFISDHLCWTRLGGRSTWDLLPPPLTAALIQHAVDRLDHIQGLLGTPLVVENISSYVRFAHDEMTEAAFIREVLHRSGAKLLLDMNNLYVNAINHDFEPMELVACLNADQIAGYHLAGHSRRAGFLFDTHDGPVQAEPLALCRLAFERFGPKPLTLEWDQRVPPWEGLLSELSRLRAEIEPVSTTSATSENHVSR